MHGIVKCKEESKQYKNGCEIYRVRNNYKKEKNRKRNKNENKEQQTEHRVSFTFYIESVFRDLF